MRAALALAFAALLAAGCGGRIVKPSKLENWEPRPAAVEGMRMTLFATGMVKANFKEMVKGGTPEEVAGPVLVALIEHPKGNVLIDLGFGANHAKHVKTFPANLFNKAIPVADFDLAKSPVVAQLATVGVDPKSIRWMLVTHMHWDHIGGLQDFPGARLVVTRAEWHAAHRPKATLAIRGYAPSMYEPPIPEAMLVEWTERPYGTFERSLDLFGDGSIVLVDTSGHTPGSMSVFVNLPDHESFLFIGDAAWVRENYRLPAHKGWKTHTLDNGRRGVMPTLWRIKRLEELAPDVVIVPAHDPHLWPQLKHAPEWYP